MKLFYYICRFWQLDSLEKRMLIYAFYYSSIIYFGSILLPTKVLFYFIAHCSPNLKSNKANIDIKYRIIMKSIRTLIQISPWKINCLNKAYVVNRLLKLQGIKSDIRFGLKKQNNVLTQAHAWVYIKDNQSYFYLPDFISVQQL